MASLRTKRLASLLSALLALMPAALVEIACTGPRVEAPRPEPSASAVVALEAPTRSGDPPVAIVAPPCKPLPEVDAPPPLGSVSVPSPALSAGLKAGAGAGLKARCAELQAAEGRNVRSYPGYKKQGFWTEESHATVGRCFAGPRGAWIVVQSAFTPRRLGMFQFERATWELVYLDASGKAARSKDASGELVVSLGESDGGVSILALHDFDDDGVAEVLLQTWSYAAIDGMKSSTSSFTVHAGAVVPWAHGHDTLAWIDLDRDGRPELLRRSPYELRDVPSVSRVLPGGAISEDDEVVRAVHRLACPSPPVGALNGEHALLCARLWGAPPDEVSRRLLASNLDASCTGWLFDRMKAWKPSPILQGHCPSPGPMPHASACNTTFRAP